jgi:hypothetical protein
VREGATVNPKPAEPVASAQAEPAANQ